MLRVFPCLAIINCLAAVCSVRPLYAGTLNDTGITECADNSSNNLPCPVAGFPRQDAQLGRDAAWKAGKLQKIGGGHAGFDYTKLDGTGKSLPAGAASWACVRDNVTGLVWENKTDNGGLRDADNTYTWYNPNSNTNGGYPGTQNGGSCTGSDCDTDAYAKAVNAAKLCGFADWRLPTKRALMSLVDRSIPFPGSAIDSNYFPNIHSTSFWSASPYAVNSNYAWIVHFSRGNDYGGNKNYGNAVRLVRGGQSFDPLTVSIAQSPLSGSEGDYFVQWGDGFSPNSTATLHVKKPDGTEYPTQQQAIDGKGHFAINYKIPAGKPVGTYTWWAVDGKNGKQSAPVAYQITPLTNVTTIYGKLHIDSADGVVLSGAKVSTGIQSTTTARDGSFSLAKIPAGDQVINFSKSGYQPFSITISVPSRGSYNMGNRWLVQNGLIKPTIAQAPMSGLPGTTFTQWGTGFTPTGTATLHFKKPDNTEYPPITMSLDNIGHLETSYHTPMNKPAGIYSWWAVDNATNKTSNTVAYTVTEAVNTCKAPTQYDSLLKITNATCRDKWNLTIFYKERYDGYFAKNQNLLQKYIKGTLNLNSYVNTGIDLFFSIQSIGDISSLKNKDIQSLVGIGTNESLHFDAKIIDNQFADIWFGAVGAALQTVAEGGNPEAVIQYGLETGFSAYNNLLATIGVTTLTKRFQELEIAKQYLLNYYRYGSRQRLLAVSYGLSASAGMDDIIKAIGDQIGTGNPWYWFDNYNLQNVINYIRTDMNMVSMKQTVYSQ